MLIRKISLRLNNQNTPFWICILISWSKFSWLTICFFLVSEHWEIGFIVEYGVTEKISSCSMTVMLLKIMKSLNISSALCCCLGKSCSSILVWNIISSKAPMELKTESVIRTLQINFFRESWNDVLHGSLMGTRKRIHQWFLISPPSNK